MPALGRLHVGRVSRELVATLGPVVEVEDLRQADVEGRVVGVLALVSFITLYLGFNFLKGKDFFSSQNKYIVIYDNVEGLTSANQVSVSGMKVGQVKAVELIAGNKVKVTLVIRKDLPLPIDTKQIMKRHKLRVLLQRSKVFLYEWHWSKKIHWANRIR